MELNLHEKNFNTLSDEELLEVDGGIAFIPILIAGGKIFAGSAITAFVATSVGKLIG